MTKTPTANLPLHGRPLLDAASDGLRSRAVNFATHLICIGMLFIVPEMLNTAAHGTTFPVQLKLGFYCKSLVYVVVFYVNYYFVIGRAFEQHGFRWRLIGWNLVIILLGLAAFWVINTLMEPYWQQIGKFPGGRHRKMMDAMAQPDHCKMILNGLRFWVRDVVMLVLTIGLSVALKLSEAYTAFERRASQEAASRQQQELDSLREQLNPHFLFNTLNTIYALVAVNPPQAQNALHELSKMLRYVLYENAKTVELSRELAFVRSYLQLMSLRMAPGQLEVNVTDNSLPDSRVAPLLFMPLIENAFKHGNTGNPADRITVNIQATPSAVTCQVKNAVGHATLNQDKAGGIGLQNLRRRLELIYGQSARLTLSPAPRSFTASLTLPLSAAHAPL